MKVLFIGIFAIMLISNSKAQNIGIGTIIPSAKLTVKSPGNNDGFILERNATTAKLIRMYELNADGCIEVRSANDVIISSLSGFSGSPSYFMSNVGIGTTTPDNSAILELKNTGKGFLMPRMTTVQRNLIASPAVGLQIFNLDDQCQDLFDGVNWIKNCGLKVTGVATDPYHSTSNSWVQKANFGGTGRRYAVGFSIGNKGYIGTGEDGTKKKDFWEYDPAGNTWTQKADFGGSGRTSAVGFSIGSKGYIGTGIDGTFQKDFWEYDPAGNSWTQKADFGGTARSGAVGFSIGSKGYIGTGGDNFPLINDFWEYDPSNNAWTQKANFGGPGRTNAVGFSIGSKGYIGTGWDIGGSHFYRDFWEYNPIGNVWTQKANYPDNIEYAVGFSIGSNGYIGIGTKFNDNFYKYDPSNNAWTLKANFGGSGYRLAVGFSIGNKGYIGTGDVLVGPYTNEFWEYMDDNINGAIYSSNAIASNNAISNGSWTLNNNTIYNANAGFVGIGTSSPSAKLTIKSTGNTDAVVLERSGTTAKLVRLYEQDADGYLEVRSGGDAIVSKLSGYAASPTYFLSNVGIGTTNPTQKLSVTGNICYTGSIGACSDKRYKKDIVPLTNSLNKVLQMNGVNYNWKVNEFPDKQFTENKQVGFIAQEIEKLYPELVITGSDGYKSVDYSKLTPILVEAIKELKATIDKQNAETEAHNKKADEKIKMLEEKINSLLNVQVSANNK